MFFQKAFEGENQVWKWILTPVMAIVGYTFGQIPLGIAMVFYMAKNDVMTSYSEAEIQELLTKMDFAALGMDLNLTLFLLLLMFVFMALALIFFLKIFHKRNWKTLITPLEKIDWGKIGFSFMLWLAFTMGLEAFSYYTEPEVYTLTFEWSKFLPLLLIVILLMPIQTTTEELLFRGYLMQGFGRWTGSKLFAILITSLLFSGMHMMNPEVAEFGIGIMFTYYASVGFFLGLLTAMDDSLELAIGVHAATNMFSAIFVSYAGGALQTNAIFRTEVVNGELMLPIFFVIAAIFFMICWKKYNWEGWSRLLEPIKPPPIVEPQIPDLPNINP